MSEVKVNKISPRSGTTVTLGDSGDTFTIPSGATINNQGTATNFGATGSASWTTTVKTSGFTAVAGEGYFVDTTSGAISVNLPAGTAGAVVAFKDYLGTFDTNALTLVQNGSDKIGGSTVNATLDTEGIAVTLVFIDSTQGWLVTDSGLQSESPTDKYITATGGTVVTCGNFKTHVFTSPGTFCVSCGGNAAGSNSVDYVVVAGGGGAQGDRSGGGGAGGFRVSNSIGCIPAPTMSPLSNPTGLPVSVQGYSITVGGGGAAGSPPASNASPGGTSTFSTISSAGGGGGTLSTGANGGSGSGGYCNPGGTGNTPPVSPSQGNPGGIGAGGPSHGAGGGGGAGAAGSNGTTGGVGGAGGAGSFVAVAFISPGCAPTYGEPGPVSSTRYFAGGGGGSFYGDPGPGTPGAGGVGGGGDGANCSPGNGGAGVTNTGGGGGGGVQKQGPGTGGAGGSGIVLIRYKFQ